MKDSDVIVVGGGPCGSFAALHLAKLGIEVNVFEEHSEVGAPCHCAGHLSIGGLRLLGLYPLPAKIVENTFRGATIHSPNGEQFRIRFSSAITCAVNRVLFDKHIASSAMDAGANYFLDSKVESLIVNNGSVKGAVVKHRNNEEKFLAKIVVDAEGVAARILRQSGLFAFNSRDVAKGVQAHAEGLEGLETNMVDVFLGRHYAPGLYGWLMPTGDGKAKIGLATKTRNPRQLLERLMHRHPNASKKLEKAKISKVSYHPIPLGGPIVRTFSNGLLVVGDAAAQVKPTTGGGVIYGMNCARTAAKVVSDALQSDNFSSEFLNRYQKRWKEKLGLEFAFMVRMRKMFDSLDDRRTDDLIRFCTRIGLDKAFQKSHNVDFQRRELLRLLWNPRISLSGLYLLLLISSCNRKNLMYHAHVKDGLKEND